MGSQRFATARTSLRIAMRMRIQISTTQGCEKRGSATFRNHYILTSNTFKSCNRNRRKLLKILLLESGTLWGANFAKKKKNKNAKHKGHACLEVSNLKFIFVNFCRATSKAKSHYFPSGSLFFSKKCPKPTGKMTFLMSSWPFGALVLRIP